MPLLSHHSTKPPPPPSAPLPQLQSPLLALPFELRQLIFHFTLLPHPNPFRPYSQHTYHYRPQHTHTPSLSLSLLRTCRQVYAETHHLALSTPEFLVYGCESSRAPPGWRDVLGSGPPVTSSSSHKKKNKMKKGEGKGKKKKPGVLMRGLLNHLPSNQANQTSHKRGRWGELPREGGVVRGRGVMSLAQRAQVRQVKVFAQQFWLEDWSGRGMWGDFCASWDSWGSEDVEEEGKGIEGKKKEEGGLEKLRVTIRHTDWWYFLLGPSRSPLALEPRMPGRRGRLVDEWMGFGDVNFDHQGSDSEAEEEEEEEGQGAANNDNGIGNGNASANDGVSLKNIYHLPLRASQVKHPPHRHRPGDDFEARSWGAKLAYLPPSLRTFELELESTIDNTAALENIIAHQAPEWRFPLAHGTRVLVFDAEATERWNWTGSAAFKGSTESSHGVENVPATARGWGGEQSAMQQGRRRSMFGTLMDRSKSAGSRTGSVVEERGYKTLDYQVVVLRFRAMRPQDAPPVRRRDAVAAAGVGGNGEAVAAGPGLAAAAAAHVPTAPNGNVVGPAHAVVDPRSARQVGRDVVPSYWG